MARRRRDRQRKLRTREHVLSDLSHNYVEKQALRCSFTAQRVQFDYGIDMIVQTFNRWGEAESSRILFQLKATDRLKLLAGEVAVPCRVERADLIHWLAEAIPVVLVLYDAKADIAYWAYIQRHFAQLAGFDLAKCGKRITVKIPSANVLNPLAMRELAHAKNAIANVFRGVNPHAL